MFLACRTGQGCKQIVESEANVFPVPNKAVLVKASLDIPICVQFVQISAPQEDSSRSTCDLTALLWFTVTYLYWYQNFHAIETPGKYTMHAYILTCMASGVCNPTMHGLVS